MPLVMKQLSGKIPPAATVIGLGVSPEGEALLAEASRMKPKDLQQGFSESDINDVKDLVRRQFGELRRTVAWQAGGIATHDNYVDAGVSLSLMLMHQGMSRKEAAEKSYRALAGYKYEFEDGWRVPKSALGGATTLTALRDGADAAKFDIAGPARDRAPSLQAMDQFSAIRWVGPPGAKQVGDLAAKGADKLGRMLHEQRAEEWKGRPRGQQQSLRVPAYPPGMRPEDAEEQWRDTVRTNSFWVTSPGDGGLTLYVKSGLGAVVVLDGNGAPVQRTWAEISAIGNSVRTAYMRDVYKPGVRAP